MRVSLSEAKAKLSEYVRLAQEQGETITITVDQRPAAEIRAVAKPARELTPAEILMIEAFSEKLCAEAQDEEPFNVVHLMDDVRR
jgi:prevent-host-death family protein